MQTGVDRTSPLAGITSHGGGRRMVRRDGEGAGGLERERAEGENAGDPSKSIRIEPTFLLIAHLD